MKNFRQFGHAVMTLSDMVDDFCLAQGNMRQSNILAQYRHARWAWKDFFKTTQWNIRKAVLELDCHSHTVKLPDDCERLLVISVVDCYGKLHALGFNTDFNTAEIRCLKSPRCSCGTCNGQDTICAAIDTIGAVTETIIIHGQPYTQTTLTRYDGSGAVQTQTTTPAWDTATSTVVYNTTVKTICNVETTDRGCIKATQPNMDLLRDFCGCGNFENEWNSVGRSWSSAYREVIPTSYNYWGEWNFNAADNQIVHIFSGCKHFGHTDEQEQAWQGSIRQVIIDYQTNGETPGTEILIPEYAVPAVQVGMVYQQKFLGPRTSEADKRMAKAAYMQAKVDVAKYLNPIMLENIGKLQTNQRLW